MYDQMEFLKSIASRLSGADIPYMITGSMAMAFLSRPRMTRDIDIVLNAREADATKLISLFAVDCYIDLDAVREAVRRRDMFNIIHNHTFVKADFILLKNDEYRLTEFRRRRKLTLADFDVFAVAAEDLILSKLVWAKPSHSELQLRDVKNLVAAQTNLDWKYLDRWSTYLGVADLLTEIQRDE